MNTIFIEMIRLGRPLLVLVLLGAFAPAQAQGAAQSEPVETTICRIIETSARSENLPVVFLSRLIWRESSFRPGVTSPAGAQGIAQFMPATAGERGLANPFDPEAAIPKAAGLLTSLAKRFGNLGLAAAAYNGGPARVAAWLDGSGSLPAETRAYVAMITRHPAEDWTGGTTAPAASDAKAFPVQTCIEATAILRRGEPRIVTASSLLAPWGVQLTASFNKVAALAEFRRIRSRYAGLLGDVTPMILGGRLASRGSSPFYRIRLPATTRAAANALCTKITRAGGACSVLRS